MTLSTPSRKLPEITRDGDECEEQASRIGQDRSTAEDAQVAVTAAQKLFFVSADVPPPPGTPPAPAADKPPAVPVDRTGKPAGSDRIPVRWEFLERDGRLRKNYFKIRDNIADLAPFIGAELLQGTDEEQFQAHVTKIMESVETSVPMRELLKKVLALQPGDERNKLMAQVAQSAQGEKLRADIEQLVATEKNRQPGLASVATFQAGMEIESKLQGYLSASDPVKKQAAWSKFVAACAADKSGLVAGITRDGDFRSATLTLLKRAAMPADGAGGEHEQQLLRAFLSKVQQRVFDSAAQLYPVAARFLQVAGQISAAQFKEMKIGDNDDVKSEDRFSEGCPFPKPLYDGHPMSFDLFLTKLAKGEIPIDLSATFEGALTASGSSKFEDAVQWIRRSQALLEAKKRDDQIADCWTQLRGKFGAPPEWAPPYGKGAAALDAWFNAANRIRNELAMLEHYTKAYLTMRDVLPEKREEVLRELRKQGFVIEWDSDKRQLKQFTPPPLKSLKILSPEVEQTVSAWAHARQKFAGPIDKIFESMKPGDTAFFRHGIFPGDKGFILMKDGKPTFITQSKTDAKGKVTDPGKIVTYLRRADGKEETIDINRDGQFITKDGANVTAEVAAIDPKKVAERDRVEFDYIKHRVSSKEQLDGTIEFIQSREFMKDEGFNYHYVGGTSLLKIGKQSSEPADKYVAVVSSSTGRTKFVRADDVSGLFGWKSGQIVGDGLGTAAGVGTDVAMAWLGPAGVVRGAAARSWGTFGVGLMRTTFAVASIASPWLRRSETGRDALQGVHYGIMADISVGLGKGALNLLLRRAAAAETTLLMDRIAHGAMLSAGGLMAPSVLNSIAFRLEKRRNSTPAELAEAARIGIPINSDKFDEMYRPFDMSKPERRKEFDAMLAGQQDLLCTGVDKATAQRIEQMFHRMREAMTKAPGSTEIGALRKDLTKIATREGRENAAASQAEVIAAATLLIYLGTDATGKVSENLSYDADTKKRFGYEDALKILQAGLSQSADRTAREIQDVAKWGPTIAALKMRQLGIDAQTAETLAREFSGLPGPDADQARQKLALLLQQRFEPLRLQCGDVLFSAGKLPTRKFAAVCADILESRALPDVLRQRALFDGGRPRLAILLNDLQAEEQLAAKGDRSQAFLGTIHGYRAVDIQKLIASIAERDGIRKTETGGGQPAALAESSGLRAASILALQVMQAGTSEQRVQLADKFAQKIEELQVQGKGKPEAATNTALAQWAVAQLKTQVESQPLKGGGTIEQRVAQVEEKLRAILLLQTLGHVDGKPTLTPEQVTRRMLECIFETPGQSQDAFVGKGSSALADVIQSLNFGHLDAAEKQALLKVLLRPTTDARNGTNEEIAAAKIALLQRLPELIAGDDAEAVALRAAAKAALHASLQLPLFDDGRVSLRLETYAALGACGFDDATSLSFIAAALQRTEQGAWREHSSYVRRQALESYYKLAPADAYRIAQANYKLETDGALARRYEQMVKEYNVKMGIARSQEDVRQAALVKLSDPHKLLRDEGKALLNTERFALLKKEYIDAEFRKKLAEWRGCAMERLFARVYEVEGYASFDDAIVAIVNKETQERYEAVIKKLCQEAMDTKNPDASRAAILAMAELIDTKGGDTWLDYAAYMQSHFSFTLAELCKKPHQNRDLVATLTKHYLESKIPMDWVTRWNLYCGFRSLARSGALDKEQQHAFMKGALEAVVHGQVMPKEGKDRKICLDLLGLCIDDLVELCPRDPEVLGNLRALADKVGSQDPPWRDADFAAVAARAQLAYHRVTESAISTLLRYRGGKGAKGTPDELADRLSGAFFDYQEKFDAPAPQGETEQQRRRFEKDKLIDSIFKFTEGSKIESTNDPRFLLLVTMGFGADDPQIAEACALALIRSKASAVAGKGYILLASLDTKNKPGLKKDVDELVGELRELFKKRWKDKNPNMPEKYYETMVDVDLKPFYQYSKSKNEGALCAMSLAKELVPAGTYSQALATRHVRDWQHSLGLRQTERLALSIARSIRTCPLVKDDVRLPFMREMLNGDVPEKIALSICLHLAISPDVSVEDKALAIRQLEKLRHSASETLKDEAEMGLRFFRTGKP